MSETITNLIAEARKTHWHHPHRLAIDWACKGDCLQSQLADACEQLQTDAAKHKRLLRKAALLDAAGDVCQFCAEGIQLHAPRSETALYRHGNVRTCQADSIHRRVKEEGL